MFEDNKKLMYLVSFLMFLAAGIGSYAFFRMAGDKMYPTDQNGSETAAGLETADDAERALFEQSKDKDFAKRLHAVRMLGTNGSLARENFLKAYVARPDISDIERITGHVSLYRIATQAEQKQEQITKLLSLEKSTKSELIKTQVMIQMIYLLPTDPRTLGMAQTVAQAGIPKGAVPIAEKFLNSQPKKIAQKKLDEKKSNAVPPMKSKARHKRPSSR